MPTARCVAVLVAVAAACVSPPTLAAGSSVLWRNDWYASAPLSLNHQVLSPLGEHSATVAFAPDRDVVLAAPSRHMVWSSSRDYQQIVRLRADGSVRWVNNFAGFGDDAKARAIHAAADGSAIVLLGNDSNAWTMVARLDAGGELAWRRYLPGDRILRISPTRLALASCNRLSVLDEADGNVVWQRSFGTATCAGGLLQVDDEGNIYFASFDEISARYRVIKLDTSGHEWWRRSVSDWQPIELAGVGSELLYLSGLDAIVALRTSDGSEVWRAPAAKVVTDGTPESEPVVITNESVARLDPETGKPRWSTPLEYAWAASVVADSLLVSTYNTRKRIDLESGAVLWDVSDEDEPVSLIAFGDLQAGTVRAIGRPSSLDARGAPYLDYRIDFSNGQRVSQLPAAELDQGLDATNAVDAGGNVVAFALSQQPGFGMSHLRRVDAASGATLWERTDLLDDFWPEALPIDLERGLMATAGDHVAVVVPLRPWYQPLQCHAEGVSVGMYELDNGTRRWKRLLRDDDQLCTRASSPSLDPAGNVFLSVNAKISCTSWPPTPCGRRTLYKLANADGAVLWRVDEDIGGSPTSTLRDPQDIEMFGGDPIVAGPFDGEAAVFQRHSGSDGSVLWSSSEFSGPAERLWQLERIGEHRLIAYGTDSALNQRYVAKIDTDTGATLWRTVTIPSPTPPCESLPACIRFSEPLVMSNGDLLNGLPLNGQPWLELAHNDGSGIIDRWLAASGSSNLDSTIYQVMRDPQGVLRAMLRRQARRASTGVFATIDMSTGLLANQQALHGYSTDTIDKASTFGPMTLPAGDRMLANHAVRGDPAPPSGGIALLDTSIAARGNVDVTATIDTQVRPGDLVPFTVKAEYSGDRSIQEVGLIADLPWQSGIRSATCIVQAASNCSMDLRSGHVRASFDMDPGGSVEIHGEVLVLDGADSQQVTAMVTGPLALSEEDSIDNFDQLDILQSLFANGFEQSR